MKIRTSDINASGSPSATTYLRGDGSWATPAGGGGGGGGSGAMSFIGKVVAAGGESSLSVSSIPSTYKHLRVVTHCRSDHATDFLFSALRFNGDSGTNYDVVFDVPNNSNGRNNNQTQIDWTPGAKASLAPHFWSGATLDILDYTSSEWKVFIGHMYQPANDDPNDGFLVDRSGKWKNTAALNQITWISTATGMFEAGSYIEVWGIDETGGGGGGGSGWDFQPPTASTFSTLVSGDSANLTLTDDTDIGLVVTTPYTGSGILRGAFHTLTDKTQDWTAIAKVRGGPFTPDYLNFGIMPRDSVSGRVNRFGLATDSGVYVVNDNSMSSYSSVPWSLGGSFKALEQEYWLKIEKTSTDLKFYISPNGKAWDLVYTTTPTGWLTNLPDQIGIYICTLRGIGNPIMTVPYWSLTGPGA